MSSAIANYNNPNLRGDRTETYEDERRSPEFRLEGRSHSILVG